MQPVNRSPSYINRMWFGTQQTKEGRLSSPQKADTHNQQRVYECNLPHMVRAAMSCGSSVGKCRSREEYGFTLNAIISVSACNASQA